MNGFAMTPVGKKIGQPLVDVDGNVALEHVEKSLGVGSMRGGKRRAIVGGFSCEEGYFYK